MMKRFIVFLAFMLLFRPARAGLIINEAVTESISDWVELAFTGVPGECMDVSPLFVTMYYGTNERLAAAPVTICADDRPGTDYDDRFIVAHLAEPSMQDETDLTGDTDKNGYLDVYCNNYYGSLWNSDGVVAIDSDDDPENGGIIDFLVYSNRDSSPNDSVGGYVAAARSSGQWDSCAGMPYQDCAVYTGENGLDEWKSISRIAAPDTNGSRDFSVTSFVTPGRPNIFPDKKVGHDVFKILKRRVPVSGKILGQRKCSVPIFVNRPCFLRFRVFSLGGICLHRSALDRDLHPGNHSLDLNRVFLKSDYPAGLYICHIEASAQKGGSSQSEIVYLIVSDR